MEFIEHVRFERIELIHLGAWPTPNKRNLPNVDHPIGDDVATGARDVTIYALTDSILTLTHINRHFVEIAERVDAYFTRNMPRLFLAVMNDRSVQTALGSHCRAHYGAASQASTEDKRASERST